MAPQVVQYPRATSLTAHSSRAVGVEVAAWAASLIAAPVGETFFAQHEAFLALCETKFALLTQNRRIWGVLRALGEFCHAQASNKPSMAKKVTSQDPTSPQQDRRPPMSHAIRLEEISTTSENVGIPILQIHDLKEPRGNCMRNCKAPTESRRCGGRRRDRRAQAGFEIDHSEPSGSRVAISRAAGPDGAQNTSGATSTTERRSLRTPRSTPGSGRPGGRRGGPAR